LDPGGSGQYYCHLFLPEQPDLNWANPAVMGEFAEIMRWWCHRGADGFRIDVAHGLTKDPEFRSNPQPRPTHSGMHPIEVFGSFDHIYDLHRIETAHLFRQWRDATADIGAVLVGEMDTRNVDRFAEFVARGDALHAGFVLQVGLHDWDPAGTIATMLEYQAKSNGGTAWEVSNHDQARAVSRYGGGEVGLRRTLALTTLMAAFDGMLFLYQGEELGLPDAVVIGHAEDPMSARNGEGMWSRDVARGPMPWNTDPAKGFTTAPIAWLHTEELPPELTVDFQTDRVDSTWHRYRSLTRLRRLHPELWQEPFEMLEQSDAHVVIGRGAVRVVANLGPDELPLPSAHDGEVLFESIAGAVRHENGRSFVAHESTIVTRAADAGGG
jgi:alpha-glucosidase